MDEKKMTQEEKDFIDKFVETAQNGAKKLGKGVEGLSKTALKTAAMAAMTAGVAIGAMTADLPGMEISEAQAAASVHVQPSKPQPAVRTGNTGRPSGGGGYNRPSGSRGGGYSAPRSGGGRQSYPAPAPAPQPVSNVTYKGYDPSSSDLIKEGFYRGLGDNASNLVWDFGSNLWNSLTNRYSYGNLSSLDRRHQQIVLAAESDWNRAAGNGVYRTLEAATADAQRLLGSAMDDPKVAAAFNEVKKNYLAIEAELVKANKKLDDQKLTLDEMKQLQLDAQRDAQKYHNETMRAIEDGDKSITDNQVKIAEALKGVSDKVDVISADVKGISDKMMYYVFALIGLGVAGGAAVEMGRRKFNRVDKKIDGMDVKLGRIGDTTDGNFKQLDDLLKEVGVVRDTTDATFGKVYGDLNGVGSAYERTKARLAKQAEKEQAENEKEI